MGIPPLCFGRTEAIERSYITPPMSTLTRAAQVFARSFKLQFSPHGFMRRTCDRHVSPGNTLLIVDGELWGLAAS